jgi:hypothetical protein
LIEVAAALYLAQAPSLGSGAPPAAPSEEPQRPPAVFVGNFGGWDLWDNAGSCAAISPFGDRGVELRISYYPSDNAAFLWIKDPAWRSIQDRSRHRVQIYFDNGASYSNAIAEGSNPLGGAGPPGINILLRGDFLSDFAAANRMGVMMGERRLGLFSLRGTAALVERLRSCAENSLRRNPEDPFAEPS